MYPSCIGQCVGVSHANFHCQRPMHWPVHTSICTSLFKLRYALANVWGVDMLMSIVYPPRIGQCITQFDKTSPYWILILIKVLLASIYLITMWIFWLRLWHIVNAALTLQNFVPIRTSTCGYWSILNPNISEFGSNIMMRPLQTQCITSVHKHFTRCNNCCLLSF